MGFWSNYVKLKESQGADRQTLLAQIEAKFDAAFRAHVEQELGVTQNDNVE